MIPVLIPSLCHVKMKRNKRQEIPISILFHIFKVYCFSLVNFLLLVCVFLCVVCFHFQDFLKFNESHLKKLPCQILDPIPLGEGAGVGWMKDGIDSMTMPEGSSLYDLVDTGIKHTHAAVGVVVRLRKELSLVKDIPVLIAIDQVRQMSGSNPNII